MNARLRKLGLRVETQSVQRGLGLLSTAWGALLLLPGSTYNTSPGFNLLANTIPEDVIGAIFFVVGLLEIAASIWGGFRRRGVLAGLGFFMWLFIALTWLSSSSLSTGWVTYSFVAWLSGFNFWQLWVRYQRVKPRPAEKGDGNAGVEPPC